MDTEWAHSTSESSATFGGGGSFAGHRARVRCSRTGTEETMRLSYPRRRLDDRGDDEPAGTLVDGGCDERATIVPVFGGSRRFAGGRR
jgi:hypothetical protein